MSSIFYGWWNWWFLLLLYASGLTDFFAAWLMEIYPRHRKKLLILSIIMNLGILGFFKYSGFAMSNLAPLLEPFGISVPVPSFLLPLGISFYTFQSMSYTIDVYYGNCKPTKSVVHFFASLILFPQLVAGPILRAKDILPQLLPVPSTTETQRFDGLRLIAHGYFKKVVIADNLAPIVGTSFVPWNMPADSSFWWVLTIMFAFQIYCDFSGYTDIARGLAKWMGYEFQLNFNHPYSAASIRDFWSRWHISLSTWFRDYVYVPLGGSRKGTLRAHGNMWITMLLSGLWHGADWKFLIWGALHSAYLSFERVTGWPALLLGSSEQPRFLRLARRAIVTSLVLVQVLIAWVFFRAESTSQALWILKTMFSFSSAPHASLEPYLPFLFIGIAYEFYMCVCPEIERMVPQRWSNWIQPAGVAAILAACVFLRGPGNAFIYFQF
ncbi:MAG TPA: MBOAT family O-acyltransferase [Planctomycetota bacterium]|nr:MBOAT family O-acyltransferase [Planctomycetota bacterium]